MNTTKKSLFFDSDALIDKMQKVCKYKTTSLLKMALIFWRSEEACTLSVSDRELFVLDYLINSIERK